MDYLILIVSAVLIKNILLAEYLGNCPFLGTSRRMDAAAGMGAAVVFVLTLSAAGAYAGSTTCSLSKSWRSAACAPGGGG